MIDWIDGDTAFISVVFSWQLQQAYQRAVWLKSQGYNVRAGGPAVIIQQDYLSSVAEIGSKADALLHHNPEATFTSRGCIRNCSFCLVPKIEGGIRELPDIEWQPKRIICDNNLLATSEKHFNHVIDRINHIEGVDFNQGLDARLLTNNHAHRLSELKKATIRLAWDNIKTETLFMSAFEKLINAGISASRIYVYVLIGYKDTPGDALYRLEKIKSFGALPNPMRFQPLLAKKCNEYVDVNWTEKELRDYMRYWSRQKWLRPVPFSDYKQEMRHINNHNNQIELAMNAKHPEMKE